MGTLIKWTLILAILFLAMSKVELRTSIHEYDSNEIEITFPSWRTEQPWIYLKWNPGKDEWRYQWQPKS